MPVYPNIKKARIDRNLSQQAISDEIGMLQAQYTRYETGQREMPLHYIIKLAKYYNVSVDYLLGLTDE